MTTEREKHLSAALAAAAEVIDAQATHIANLERGLWSKESGERVDKATDAANQALDAIPTGPAVGPQPKPDLDWAEKAWAKHKEAKQHNHPDDGTKEPGCPRCQADQGGLIALLALHGDKAGAERLLNNLITTGDISDPPDPRGIVQTPGNMFDRGGFELPTGLVEVTNTTGEAESVDSLADFQPRRCQATSIDNGYRCLRERGHLWPHRWDTPPQDKTE